LTTSAVCFKHFTFAAFAAFALAALASTSLCQAAWDETDEWNALTMKVVQHLKSRAQIH
jgi:hypothetical protein